MDGVEEIIFIVLLIHGLIKKTASFFCLAFSVILRLDFLPLLLFFLIFFFLLHY